MDAGETSFIIRDAPGRDGVEKTGGGSLLHALHWLWSKLDGLQIYMLA